MDIKTIKDNQNRAETVVVHHYGKTSLNLRKWICTWEITDVRNCNFFREKYYSSPTYSVNYGNIAFFFKMGLDCEFKFYNSSSNRDWKKRSPLFVTLYSSNPAVAASIYGNEARIDMYLVDKEEKETELGSWFVTINDSQSGENRLNCENMCIGESCAKIMSKIDETGVVKFRSRIYFGRVMHSKIIKNIKIEHEKYMRI